MTRLTNALCIDVDDLALSNAEAGVRISEWRFTADREVEAILAELDSLALRATFFFPTLFVKRAPHLVIRAAELGHQIASHGEFHQRVEKYDPAGFLADVSRSKALLEDLTGKRIDTYKAPIWSITPRCVWAYEILREAGYAVDHSAMPDLKRHFGYPSDRMEPFKHQNGLLIIPVTVFRVLGVTVPFPGGFYNAYIPSSLQKKVFHRLNQGGVPFNFYFHPYEHSPADENRRLIKHRSLFLTLYAAHVGRYKSLLRKIANHHHLATLREAYAR